MEKGLVKTIRFRNPHYVGDPMNALKIFNDKGSDELLILDIGATRENRAPSFAYIEELASECFMPLGYGGGIRRAEDVRQLVRLGVEKCVINSAAFETPALISTAADIVGSQSVVVSIDADKDIWGRWRVFTRGGRQRTQLDPAEAARLAESKGAGEIFLTSVRREGTMTGYDLDLVRHVTAAVNVPVVANGGARSVEDFLAAVREGGASAVAAGAMFVFKGAHRAVLINMPGEDELSMVFGT